MPRTTGARGVPSPTAAPPHGRHQGAPSNLDRSTRADQEHHDRAYPPPHWPAPRSPRRTRGHLGCPCQPPGPGRDQHRASAGRPRPRRAPDPDHRRQPGAGAGWRLHAAVPPPSRHSDHRQVEARRQRARRRGRRDVRRQRSAAGAHAWRDRSCQARRLRRRLWRQGHRHRECAARRRHAGGVGRPPQCARPRVQPGHEAARRDLRKRRDPGWRRLRVVLAAVRRPERQLHRLRTGHGWRDDAPARRRRRAPHAGGLRPAGPRYHSASARAAAADRPDRNPAVTGRRRLAATLLLALAGGGCSGPAATVDTDAIPRGELRPLPLAYWPHAAAVGSPRDLGALFAALSVAHASPVSIIQVGDSHSAGDYLSARLRELFQARFGAAGRGVLPPGIPDRYYKPKLVAVTESDGWQRVTSHDGNAVAAFGIAGVVQQTATPNQTMALTSDESDGFDRVVIDYRRRPDGGSLWLSVDGGPPAVISTRGAPAKVERAIFASAPHGRTLTLQTDGDGPVELTGWGPWRHGRGVLYQNFGIVGAQADVLERYDRQALATELAD